MATKYTTLEQLTSVMNALAGKIKEKDYEQKENLKALAYKDEVSKSDLSTELQNEIDGMADEASVVQQINTQVASVYKPGGSKVAADLVAAPTKAQLGFVYNITEDFTTNANFLQGAGEEFPAGTDVGVVVSGKTYTAVTPAGEKNPSESGWFVADPANEGQYIAATDTTVVAGTTYYEEVDAYAWNVMAGFIDQTAFADATEFAEVKAIVDELSTATDEEVQAIIDGIDLENGTVTPTPNGDNIGY